MTPDAARGAAVLAYYAFLLAVIFVWPTWRLWRRERVNAFVLPTGDTPEGVIGIWFKGIILAVGAVLAAATLGVPGSALGGLGWLDNVPAKVAGWMLLVGSLAWMAVAQAQMGRSWRIGIDHQGSPPLVGQGLFALSRNPIFLGLRLNLLGFVLVVPNAATVALAVAGEALMQVQVRLEEEHLSGTLGEPYARYRSRVPRWL